MLAFLLTNALHSLTSIYFLTINILAMKNILFSFSVLMLGSFTASAQNAADLAKIEAAVHAFSNSGDQRDVSQLEKILHPQFRAVVNRAFGSPELSLMDKTLYLQLMKDKKIGGDKREVFVLQTDLGKNVATVKALFQGRELRFTTFISLVKLENGEWQIVSDMPEIEKV